MNVSSQLSVVCAANGHNKDKHGDEYIKLLSTVADNPDPPFWFKGHVANRDMLLCELTDAGFLKTEFCKDSVMATITYDGRQELDRLRSFRTKQRFEACVKWSAIIVAFATVVSAACAVVSCLTNESRRDASSLIESSLIEKQTKEQSNGNGKHDASRRQRSAVATDKQ